MNWKLVTASLAFVLGAGFAFTAHAQSPEAMVKQRQAAMTLQGKYFGPLGGMAQGKVPFNAQMVVRNAAYLNVLDEMAWDGFAESTKGTSAKTRALPAIWADSDKFKEAQKNFQAAVAKLAEASKTGDEGQIKAAIGSVGKNCGGCHDNFREKQ